MSYSIKGKEIRLTRGDTLLCYVDILKANGDPYLVSDGDHIRFAMKKNVKDPDPPLLLKEIDPNTLLLRLESADTKPFPFGEYVYDIQLTTADGDVDTFITEAPIILTPEVE